MLFYLAVCVIIFTLFSYTIRTLFFLYFMRTDSPRGSTLSYQWMLLLAPCYSITSPWGMITCVHRITEAINYIVTRTHAFAQLTGGIAARDDAIASPNETWCLNFRKDVRLATGGDCVVGDDAPCDEGWYRPDKALK